ncbi:MAG: GNAT family N-acetyltransferase [Calditrichia bacterium]
MNLDFIHDEKKRKFFAELEGKELFITYDEPDENTYDFRLTYVPPPLRRRGLAGKIIRFALETARRKNKKVIPSCWAVSKYVNQNPQYRSLLTDF